jgi:hypothetical protein
VRVSGEFAAGEFAAVDAIVSRYTGRGGAPGIAYGIVRDGELVHAGGTGERRLGGAVPDSGTVFRIASMTKSFSAGGEVRPRARWLAGGFPGGPGDDPAPADDDRRVPDR